jgi:NAD(P)-dependent dehydrogenase (short-subunit alcohol dehydrogenase family)
MSGLSSFPNRFNAVVIGSSGGIGSAMTELLAADEAVGTVLAASRSGATFKSAKVSAIKIDLLDETSIAAAAESAAVLTPRLVFVATGMLHSTDKKQPEKSWRTLSAPGMADVFALNTIGPALVAKHFLPILPRTGKSVFTAMSARVGSISDNRLGGWYSYRASKAALNMILRTAAIELSAKWPEAVCIGLHPGTVETALSLPFQQGVPPEKLFTPDFAAQSLLQVIDSLSAKESGGFFAFDGQRIDF